MDPKQGVTHEVAWQKFKRAMEVLNPGPEPEDLEKIRSEAQQAALDRFAQHEAEKVAMLIGADDSTGLVKYVREWLFKQGAAPDEVRLLNETGKILEGLKSNTPEWSAEAEEVLRFLGEPE